MHDRNMRIVVVSGGFDPIHSGHIKLLNSAKTYGDYLIVGVNSDEWLQRKKGKAFMTYFERSAILQNLKAVDEVMSFDDSDGTACDLLERVKKTYPGYPIIFANGGDRTPDNIPETEIKDIIFKFSVGGQTKVNSSGIILNNWAFPKTVRPWGWHRILEDRSIYKVKELVLGPNQTLPAKKYPLQKHWFVLEGECIIETDYLDTPQTIMISQGHSYGLGAGVLHQAKNNLDTPCHILEVRYESSDERKE
jgi:cytidyltransferase-like protein